MERGDHTLFFRFQANIPEDLKNFIEEMDDEKRKNTIRDIYEFLHARQLQVMQEQINFKLDQIIMNQQVPTERTTFFHSLWRTYVGPFTYAVVAGAGATIGILAYQHMKE